MYLSCTCSFKESVDESNELIGATMCLIYVDIVGATLFTDWLRLVDKLLSILDLNFDESVLGSISFVLSTAFNLESLSKDVAGMKSLRSDLCVFRLDSGSFSIFKPAGEF